MSKGGPSLAEPAYERGTEQAATGAAAPYDVWLS
jgi:hypothetical protein